MTDELGTPAICPKCGNEIKVRLSKGTRLKNVLCLKCGHEGHQRNTKYDKEQKVEAQQP